MELPEGSHPTLAVDASELRVGYGSHIYVFDAASAKWVDIDTRTEVYSLGIIFYELLLSSPDDSACSGLIYSGVPISAPTRVNIVSAVSFWVSAFGPGAS